MQFAHYRRELHRFCQSVIEHELSIQEVFFLIKTMKDQNGLAYEPVFFF